MGGQYAVCLLLGGDCQRPGIDDQLDLANCETSQRYSSLEYEAGAFSVGYSNEVGFETTVLGNGDIQVSYVRGQDVGAGVGVGVEVWVYTGDGEVGGGARASASIDVFANEGDLYGFNRMEDAQEFISWTRSNKGIIDTVPVVGSDTPVIGWGAGRIHEGINWGLNLGGWGQEKPPEPEAVGSWVEGGVELSGRARAGVRDGQEDEDGAIVDGSIAAVASTADKHYVDHRTGETTLYLSGEAFIEGTGELGDLGVDFAVGEESVVAVTLDADETPIELTSHSYRVDDAGQDFSGVTDRDAIDRRFGTASASGELAEPSMYEITTSLDLRDEPELADVVLDSGVSPTDAQLQDAIDRQAAVTTVAEYEVDNPRYGGRANLGKLLEFSGGGSYDTDHSDLRDAWAYDPVLGNYERWVACADTEP